MVDKGPQKMEYNLYLLGTYIVYFMGLFAKERWPFGAFFLSSPV